MLSDPGLGIYKKLVIANGRLDRRGAVRRYADGLWYLELHAFGIIDRACCATTSSSADANVPEPGSPRESRARRGQPGRSVRVARAGAGQLTR